MLPRLTPEFPKRTSAESSSSRMRSRASAKRRSISAGENLSHTTELLGEPVGDERSVLVGDVVADVVALVVEDEAAVRSLVGDPFGLLPRDDAIELPRHHQRGAFELGDDGREV